MMNNNFFFDSLSKLAGQVFGFIGKPNPETYAKAVKDLHKPEKLEDALEARLKSIEADPELTRSEKESLKNEAIEQYYDLDAKRMKACADIVDRDAEKKGEIALKIIGEIALFIAAACVANGVVNGIQNNSGLQIVPRTND